MSVVAVTAMVVLAAPALSQSGGGGQGGEGGRDSSRDSPSTSSERISRPSARVGAGSPSSSRVVIITPPSRTATADEETPSDVPAPGNPAPPRTRVTRSPTPPDAPPQITLVPRELGPPDAAAPPPNVSLPGAVPGPAGLELSDSTIGPGGRVTALGQGCAPDSAVSLSIGDVSVGEAVTDPGGVFEAALTTASVDPGRHHVVAECGRTLSAPLDVVLVSHIRKGTSTVTVILLFLVVGVWYYAHRLVSNLPARSNPAE